MWISDPQQLATAEVEENNLLIQLPNFPRWRRQVQAIAERTALACPEFEVRPYQVEHAAMFCLRRRNIAAHAQGTGKTTVTGLMIAALYPQLRRPGQVQVVAPSLLSATTRWLPDLERIAGLKGQIAILRRSTERPHAPIWIYAADYLRRQSPRLKHRQAERRRWIARDLPRPALLVVDEVHLFRPHTLRGRALRYLAGRARRILALSGTLSDGRLDLIDGTCRLVYGRHWPWSAAEFRRRFGEKQPLNSHYLEGEELVASPRYLSHLSLYRVGEYYQTFRRFVHRVRISDPSVISCVRLPQLDSDVCCVEPTVDQQQAHRKLVEEHLQLLQALADQPAAGTPNRFRLLQDLYRLANLPWELDLETCKAEHLLSLVQQARRTVVFTASVSAGRWLTEHLRRHVGSVVRLYAQDDRATPPQLDEEARERVLELYNTSARVGVFSLHLASLSIDLLTTDQVVFWDLPWQTLPVQQAITRVLRPGNRHETVRVRYLVTKGLLDTHAFNLLGQKMRGVRLLDFDLDAVSAADLGAIDASSLARALLGENR